MAFIQTEDPKAGKTLVWSDEFDEPGLPSPDKWEYETGHVRNEEAQYYTKARPENVSVGDGLLSITARKEPFEGSDYTSASVTSKTSWTYGYFEARAKVPGGLGTWPTVWLLGTANRLSGPDRIPWPACGEIDILESVGWKPDETGFSVHTKRFNWKAKESRSTLVASPAIASDYHVYGVDWSPDRIVFYFDGKQVKMYQNWGVGTDEWPFIRPQYLILNLAVGGSYGGKQGIDPSAYPATFKIDYIRVYQQPG